MAEVDISILGRPYTLYCADGQEEAIRQHAETIESKVSQYPRGSDMRSLLYAALALADEKAEAQAALANSSPTQADSRKESESSPPNSPDSNAQVGGLSANEETILADKLEHIAERIEAIAQVELGDDV